MLFRSVPAQPVDPEAPKTDAPKNPGTSAKTAVPDAPKVIAKSESPAPKNDRQDSKSPVSVAEALSPKERILKLAPILQEGDFIDGRAPKMLKSLEEIKSDLEPENPVTKREHWLG